MTELANKDELTGLRNKIAYNNMANNVGKKIKENIDMTFGIAMVGLNYLKVINDDYGHDAGDSALIKLANIVSAIFAHSPVYRIGGDEFVIYLINKDYNDIKELIEEFNEKIKELAEDDNLGPVEKVSAAIGYAIYDKEKDTCVDDVFKRADKAMYARKREMKEL